MTVEQEIDFRRRWYQAHAERRAADAEHGEFGRQERERFAASAEEGLSIIGDLARTSDLESFKTALQAWAVKPTTVAFNGFNGQMFINQLVAAEAGVPATLARLLIDGVQLPANDEEARSKLAALIEYTDEIRSGVHPSPGRVIFVLPYFWALQEPDMWPVFWATSVRYVETFNGPPLPEELVARYMAFRDRVAEVEASAWEFWQVTNWWDSEKPVFLDLVLCARCAWGEASYDELNAHALVGFARHVSSTLVEAVSEAVGRSVVDKKPSLKWTKDAFRGDTYADWWIQEKGGLGVRVWMNPNGAAVGLRVGWMKENWYEEAAALIQAHPLADYELLAGGHSTTGRDVGFSGGMAGEFVYARWFPREQFVDIDLGGVIVETATELRPLLDLLDAAAKGGQPSDFDTGGDPLNGVVKEFFAATGYPEQADELHKADREQFAKVLQPETLPTIDPSELRRIYNSHRWGSPGPQSILNVTVRDADAARYDQILDNLNFLIWGEGDDADRIDALLEGDRKIHGLGESVMMKLLSVAHPDRYVPIFPYGGPMGKRRMLGVLEIDEPQGSRGRLQVASSRAIHQRLNRFFPGDPWGMNRFCYWLAQRNDEPQVDGLESRLDDLADNELVDREFLGQIVKLLEEKGQIILYGPPGTGKTYLARKLAEALAPDPVRRKLVQFHPSTSYEDFFEGFRPEPGVEGGISYRLTDGPLALLADDARKSPGTRHVMVIDEINRANLPKVFGELLFLLEYRGEAVTTLYRPDDPFELPKDLLFIGTMNTADRSIALIDAALRRRFHFIPFFPHDGPMADLLDRWLDKNEEPLWVGEMVAMVNDELTKRLGGPHLQIGPSYFMKKGLDEAAVRLVWEYNIEPFVEDQLFGDSTEIANFKFDKVLARFRKQSALDELPSDVETTNFPTSDDAGPAPQ